MSIGESPRLLLVFMQDRDILKEITGFSMDPLPMKHLGIPLILANLSYQDCVPILDRMTKRLAGWKTRPLSYAGRLTLIKYILQSFYIYWVGIFGFPGRIICQVESIMAHFLWAGLDLSKKMHAIRWDAICKPYEEGGLNLRKVKEMNDACVLKHLWWIVSKKDNL